MPARGFLEVGLNEKREVVINHPDLQPDAQGVGHIVFSPKQARSLAHLLIKHASEAESGTSAAQQFAISSAAEAAAFALWKRKLPGDIKQLIETLDAARVLLQSYEVTEGEIREQVDGMSGFPSAQDFGPIFFVKLFDAMRESKA